MYCTHPYFSSVFSTNHYYVLYPSILLISILNKPLLCIVPIHISHQYSQQIIIMYCTHPYYSSVFSTNHYYVLYPSILLISILNKPLLCIVPTYISHFHHCTHPYSTVSLLCMYCTHPYYSSVFSTNHIIIVPISHQYSQQTIIMYCTHPYLLITHILNKSLLCIVPTICIFLISILNKPLLCIVSIFLISILNKPLLCIVPIHISHQYSQQIIIMYCTHPYSHHIITIKYFSCILNKSILLYKYFNKPLLCIVPTHISHQYSQQTIIMYCTHPYFSSVFSTNHYYVLYPSIFLISILNKPLLCIVPIHITHRYSQQTIIMYCTHPYFS